jgi:ADP-ribose pyrophosphatase
MSRPSGKAVRKVVAEGRFLRFVRIGSWEAVERTSRRPAVGVAALTVDGAIVLVEQWRPPMGATVIEIPAGLVGDLPGKSRESSASAARRELLEEAGFRAARLRRACAGPVSPGITDECVELFVASGCRRVASGGGEGDEAITVHVVPLETAETWLARRERRGTPVDVKVRLAIAVLKAESRLQVRRRPRTIRP